MGTGHKDLYIPAKTRKDSKQGKTFHEMLQKEIAKSKQTGRIGNKETFKI